MPSKTTLFVLIVNVFIVVLAQHKLTGTHTPTSHEELKFDNACMIRTSISLEGGSVGLHIYLYTTC